MTGTSPATSGSSDLANAVARHVARTPARVSSLEFGGERYWIKQVEHHRFIRGLQKGDSHQAFNRERTALHNLAQAGMPVSKIIVEDVEFFAVKDCGTPLNRVLKRVKSESDRLLAFKAAGKALAMLHQSGFSHGRPSLKDICWDGERIRFLDFERFDESRNTADGHAMDIVMFVFNAIATAGELRAEISAAIEAWREHAPAGLWERAQSWCRRHRWIIWATSPLRALTSSREFHAIPATFDAFAQR